MGFEEPFRGAKRQVSRGFAWSRNVPAADPRFLKDFFRTPFREAGGKLLVGQGGFGKVTG